MIAHLKGNVAKKANKGIIVDTGSVGYFVHLTNATLAEIEETQQIELFIHSHIKEDAFDLYGFSEHQDMEFFKQLLQISGIGPKVALEMLNVPPDKIKGAILNEDEAFICKIPGIGKKTAKRLILELKEKVDTLETEYQSLSTQSHNDAVEALIKLGYRKHQIIKNLREIPEEIQETEEIITYLLKNL